MRLIPTSVRTRLTLWYTAVLTLPLVAFAVTSYLGFETTVRARTDAFLDDALTVFARELAAERRAEPDAGDVIRRTLREVRFRELDIVIRDTTGAVVSRSAPLGGAVRGDAPAWTPDALFAGAPSAGASGERRWTAEVGGASYRVVERPLETDSRTFRIAGVQSLREVDAMLSRIRRLFLITIPLIILCAATGGLFLARRSFRPVSAMAARAAEIGANTLHERLPVVADDELGSLARVLNDLLDRLDRSFEQQRRFMTDASHELRTPTAIVRTEAEVTLSRERRSEDEYRASMAIVRDAASRLTRIVDDVFLIARADAGHLVMKREALYLEDLVRDMVRAVKPIADARGVRVGLDEAAESPMLGDPDLLGRVFLNLLDNAIKHAPDGGSIDVTMRAHGDRCDVSVVDGGAGIPAEARERVFERFYRVDAARSRDRSTLTSGAGLGLSICRRITEMHGGTLVLAESRPGRTEFRVTLPLQTST